MQSSEWGEDDMEWIDEALTEGVIPDEIPVEVAPAADLDEVNRLMRRLRHVRAQQDRVKAQYRVEVERLADWQAVELDRLGVDEHFITRALDGWVRNEFRVTGTVTHRLPYGDLTLRAKRRSVEVTDEDAATTWLREHGHDECVRTKHEVDKTALKDAAELNAAHETDTTEGVIYRDMTLEVPDAETGEVTTVEVPGVRVCDPLRTDDRSITSGLNFNVKLRDEQGET